MNPQNLADHLDAPYYVSHGDILDDIRKIVPELQPGLDKKAKVNLPILRSYSI